MDRWWWSSGRCSSSRDSTAAGHTGTGPGPHAAYAPRILASVSTNHINKYQYINTFIHNHSLAWQSREMYKSIYQRKKVYTQA